MVIERSTADPKSCVFESRLDQVLVRASILHVGINVGNYVWHSEGLDVDQEIYLQGQPPFHCQFDFTTGVSMQNPNPAYIVWVASPLFPFGPC